MWAVLYGQAKQITGNPKGRIIVSINCCGSSAKSLGAKRDNAVHSAYVQHVSAR